MGRPYAFLLTLSGLSLLLLAGGCDRDVPMPILRKTDVIIEGRIMTDGGDRPMAGMRVVLFRERPLSTDPDELYERTDANGYYRFRFKANHELNERVYTLSYDIYDVEKDEYFCPSTYSSIGYLPSADTTLVYNFLIPRKTEIQCVYTDPAKAREYELNTIFRFTCGLDTDSTRFMQETGAVSVDYTENPLLIPSNIPVIVVTRGIDRKLSKPLEKQDTILVPHGAAYVHRIDF